MSITQQFRDAMAASGLRTDADIIDDGAIHRFTVAGDKPRSLNGWYTLHSDGVPAGAFGSWKHDISATWCAKSERDFTPEERRAYAQHMEASKRQREAELERVRAEARMKAERIWSEADIATDDHPYLVAKGVKAHGLRLSRGSLVLPVRSPDGALQSLQFIDANGGKLFLKGGMKRGCYFKIGGAPVDRVIVAEGYATAATLFEAHGCPVAVAFDAGNLGPVCDVITLRLPEHVKVEIWADNDLNTPGNPGVTKATAAAAKIGATVVVPEEAGDWNDVAAAHGLAAVTQAVVPANDNRYVDTDTPLPHVGPRGKPLVTIENMAEICRRLGVVVRYNVISKDEELLIPNEAFSIDNRANASLAWLVSWCARFNMPTDKVGDFITFLADQNLYNPAANWITSKPWDGTSRLPEFYATITANGDSQKLKDTLIKRWMISAIAAAFNPEGVSAHGVLVLQGNQYLGKTKWFKSLVPAEMRLAQDGMMLRPEDRDSVKQACSFWLVELGELDATFRKSDIAALKAFLTRDRDVLRRAYAKRESEYARRTVFFASVNPREFLHDPTGNRRYWTIECDHIDHSHHIDMQQVWAEVYELYRAGEGWFLLPHEMDGLNTHNSDFEVRDPIEDRLMSKLDWQLPQHLWEWQTVTDVLVSVGIDRPEKAHMNTAGHIIRRLNNNTGKKSNGVRRVLVPPLVGRGAF